MIAAATIIRRYMQRADFCTFIQKIQTFCGPGAEEYLGVAKIPGNLIDRSQAGAARYRHNLRAFRWHRRIAVR